MRRRRSLALLLAAALAGCASQPVHVSTPEYREPGRVIGAHLGTVVLAERCTETFPSLAAEIESALRGWRWRNDSVAAAVEQRMWAVVAASGVTPKDVEVGRAAFTLELDRIAVGMSEWFASWPPERQRTFCARMPTRLALDAGDLATRYPAEVRRWQGAVR